MKKLLVMVIALAVVFGMSAGVMAWNGTSEDVNIEVNIAEFAQLYVPDNIEFNFSEPGSKTESTTVNVITNHDVTLTTDITTNFPEENININNVELALDEHDLSNGSYAFDLFVEVEYDMTGETPAGTYSDGVVTVTLESL